MSFSSNNTFHPKSLAQSSLDLPGFETVDKRVEQWCHEEVGITHAGKQHWGSVLSVAMQHRQTGEGQIKHKYCA